MGCRWGVSRTKLGSTFCFFCSIISIFHFFQGEHADAAESSCPAAAAVTTTVATVPVVTEAPVVTDAPVTTDAPVVTDAPVATTMAPVDVIPTTPIEIDTSIPIEIDTSMSMSMATMFGAKSGKAKALKSKAHAKTEKNPMAKVHKSEADGHVVSPKSEKSSPEVSTKFSIDFLLSKINRLTHLLSLSPPPLSLFVSFQIDAKAEKTKPAAKSGKHAKKGYHMFSKGQKMSTPLVESMSM